MAEGVYHLNRKTFLDDYRTIVAELLYHQDAKVSLNCDSDNLDSKQEQNQLLRDGEIFK